MGRPIELTGDGDNDGVIEQRLIEVVVHRTGHSDGAGDQYRQAVEPLPVGLDRLTVPPAPRVEGQRLRGRVEVGGGFRL